MPSDTRVTIKELLEIKTDGLRDDEIWSLLCESVQTLQDLFLTGESVRMHKILILSSRFVRNECLCYPQRISTPSPLGGSLNIRIPLIWAPVTDIVGVARLRTCADADKASGNLVPIISPGTLSINSKGRVHLLLANEVPLGEDVYLAPEYIHSNNSVSDEREKMWIYSLGKTLRSCSKRKVATGSSVAKVLRFMTTKNPVCRSSLMDLLNIIYEHYKMNVPMKPYSHLVMAMYREAFDSSLQCLSLPTKKLPIAANAFRQENSPLNNKTKANLSRSSSLKKNPVRRAPSHLYRNPRPSPASGNRQNTSDRSENLCIGPEFIVRKQEPAKVVCLGNVKTCQKRKCLTVILLTGEKFQFICNPQATSCGQIYEVLIQAVPLEDNYAFGLASLIDGDFVFLPDTMKVHKVAPVGWKDGKTSNDAAFLLYVRVKFFLPNIRGIKNINTKHLIYLQLRRSLLEQQIRCDLAELLNLGGLALQAEFGDYEDEVHGRHPYFLIEHYIPEELIGEKFELEKQLGRRHKIRKGLERVRAKEIFISQVQMLPEYGSHYHTAVWMKKSVSTLVWIAVNPQGLSIYEKKSRVLDRKIYESFVWKNIQSISCSQSYFRMALNNGERNTTHYKLRMNSKKSMFLFYLASFHHRFFLRLRIELSSLDAVSKEFGIDVNETKHNYFFIKKETDETSKWEDRKENEKNILTAIGGFEEEENKENEKPRERAGVGPTGPRLVIESADSLPEVATDTRDAYVIGTSIKSVDGNFAYDLQESIPAYLADKLNAVTWQGERVLRKVRISKDKYGCFGLEVVEGANGGMFIESLFSSKGDDDVEWIQKGDEVLAVDGHWLVNMSYGAALGVLKNAGNSVELLLSRSCAGERKQKLVECEYLKNIRYDTAPETDPVDSH